MKLQLTYTKNQNGTEYLLCNEKNNFYHLPLNNAPTLEGVHLLPPLEDESNFFAEQETIKNEWNSEKSFKAGYNKTKEKYKWTDEDLKKAINMARLWDFDEEGNLTDHPTEDEIIQSLQQSKYPVAFECEIVDNGEEGWIGDDFTGEPFWNEKLEPKTITNSQGLTQVVGKYIY
jgi:hypothetical protein